MADYTLHQAGNGLTTLLVPRPETEAVSVMFFFRAGSRYETPDTNGLAHFTEHMVFKGGQHFPTFQKVNDSINHVGGYFNAYTAEEITAFYVKIGGDKVAIALDVLSDILTKPLYEQAELDKERGVIIEEINMYEDDPSSQLPVLMDATMYPGHPIGRPVIGTKVNIKSFPRQLFVDYTKAHLTPDRAVLAVTGKTDKVTEKLLAKFVGRFDGRSEVTPEPASPQQTEPRLGIKKRQTEQTHLGLGLRGPSLRDRKKSIRLEVLSTILGGNTSSRLFTEVREKQGLAYAVSSSPEQLTDTGSLDVYAGVSHDKAEQALVAILRELRKLRDGQLTETELSIAKESIKGTRALRWEDSVTLGTLYGVQQLLLEEIQRPKELLGEFAKVTKDDIITLAKEIITEDRLNVAVVGPQSAGTFKNALHFDH